MAQLLYGSGIRLMESGAHRARLRVKDLEFVQHQIVVRDTKGNEDRVTMPPQRVIAPLKIHLVEVKKRHELALANGYGTVEMPYALARKYPNSESEWMWQSSAGSRLRYPHRSRIAWPQRCQDHADLHPCPQQRADGCPQSVGLDKMRR